jgi:DNA-directed RNA polymerase subunit RPC12/RpoP
MRIRLTPETGLNETTTALAGDPVEVSYVCGSCDEELPADAQGGQILIHVRCPHCGTWNQLPGTVEAG